MNFGKYKLLIQGVEADYPTPDLVFEYSEVFQQPRPISMVGNGRDRKCKTHKQPVEATSAFPTSRANRHARPPDSLPGPIWKLLTFTGALAVYFH